MKKLTLLFTALYALSASAQVKIIEGQYPTGITAPTNYVKNVGCYTNKADITVTGGTLLRNTTLPINVGIGADCKWTATALAQTLSIGTKTTIDPLLKGQNCQFDMTYMGDGTGYKAYLFRGTKLTSDYPLVNSGTVVSRVSMLVPCGDLTVATIPMLEATGATPAALQFTAASYGLATNIGQANVITEWVNYASILNAAPTQGFGTITDHVAWARRVGSELEIRYVGKTGGVTATEARLALPPGLVIADTIPNLTTSYRPDGAVAVGRLDRGSSTGVADNTILATPGQNYVGIGNATGSQFSMVRVNGNGVINSSEFFTVTASIPIQGFAASNVVRLDQSNFDSTPWAITSPNASWTTVTPTANKCNYSRNNNYLEFNCLVLLSGGTATEGRLSLPSGLTTASTYTTNSTDAAWIGQISNSQSTDNNMLCVQGGKNYINVCAQRLNTYYGGTIVNANVVVVNTVTLTGRVLIEGWSTNQNAPLLVGGVTSSSQGLVRVEVADLTLQDAVNCSITRQIGNWISSATRLSAGRCQINFAPGTFSAAPICTGTVCGLTGEAGCGGYNGITNSGVAAMPTATSWSPTIINFNTGGTQDNRFSIQCVGPR